MTDTLLRQFSEQQLVGFMLVLARVGPLFLLAPGFSSRFIPARAKGIAAVGIAFGMAPFITEGVHVSLDALELGELIVKELLVGTAFAFAIAAIFAAVSVAGNFLDFLIGFAFGSLVDPITGNQGTVLQQIYSLVGVMIFIAIGGDGWAVQGLARSYDAVGVTETPSIPALVGGANSAFVQIFHSALELAAPVILALVITDAAMGLVARVVPQMNVFAVGFSVKIAVGILVMAASLPFAGGWIADELQTSVEAALRTLRVA
jgi:flagellar biosynthesis protein FliR